MTKFRAAVLLVMLAVVIPAVAQSDWKQVSEVRFDWDGSRGVRITFEIPRTWNDPGEFTRIHIDVPGQKPMSFTNESGWVKYTSKGASLRPALRQVHNFVQSDFALALRASKNRTLLFLFGYPYASSPGSLDVFGISESGEVRVVLHREELGLADLIDLDSDGVSEIVGYPCLSQLWGNGLSTYDPFNIYKLAPSKVVPATMSLPLSKSYNLMHYYGWAGPECSEDFAVVLHPPNGGKPIVMSSKDAQKLTDAR